MTNDEQQALLDEQYPHGLNVSVFGGGQTPEQAEMHFYCPRAYVIEDGRIVIRAFNIPRMYLLYPGFERKPYGAGEIWVSDGAQYYVTDRVPASQQAAMTEARNDTWFGGTE